jgi:hypothetical protein
MVGCINPRHLGLVPHEATGVRYHKKLALPDETRRVRRYLEERKESHDEGR